MLRCPICSFKKTYLKYKVEKYHYFECTNCATLFLNPLPRSRTIKSYYLLEFEYTAGKAEESRIRERAKIILKKLKRLNPNGRTLLDIGSGYGYFLDEAYKQNLKVTGIEPSRELYVQSTCLPAGRLNDFRILNLEFDQYFMISKYKQFDFITAIHLVEHLCDPLQFIKKVGELMNPNGILYIETPNYDSWLAKAEKQNYTFLTPPDHVYLLSKRSLRLTEVRIPNLQIESISTYSYPEHLMGIIKEKIQNPNIKTKISNKQKKEMSLSKELKFAFFDKLIAPLFTPLLNIGGYGSILELYIRKK